MLADLSSAVVQYKISSNRTSKQNSHKASNTPTVLIIATCEVACPLLKKVANRIKLSIGTLENCVVIHGY